MRRKNQTNQIVRESITQALLLLMQTQPFAQINITQLVERAGVSRVSFYRNFHSVEDIIQYGIDWMAQRYHQGMP